MTRLGKSETWALNLHNETISLQTRLLRPFFVAYFSSSSSSEWRDEINSVKQNLRYLLIESEEGVIKLTGLSE